MRGLKSNYSEEPLEEAVSHPTRVRGLKCDRTARCNTTNSSHPTRVRGLKFSLCLSFDCLFVAPYTGAWIEITFQFHLALLNKSHPTRVRGLKFVSIDIFIIK